MLTWKRIDRAHSLPQYHTENVFLFMLTYGDPNDWNDEKSQFASRLCDWIQTKENVHKSLIQYLIDVLKINENKLSCIRAPPEAATQIKGTF